MRLLIYLLIINLSHTAAAYGVLAGGRPNAFSGGLNALAGVVNPANAVWIADRIDIGTYWVYQKSSITNHNNNPIFPPGKTDLTHRSRNLFTVDAAIHKQIKLKIGSKDIDSSFSLAVYSLPSDVKLRTKKTIPITGTTPIMIRDKTEVISAVFSVKLNTCHSIGMTIDYFYLTHRRDGFQNSDNPHRSVSPGHVTNNGKDHSSGMGCSIGWRWKVTEKLDFGAAWSRKSDCGQFRRYRGYEPRHAKNYTSQLVGAGFTCRFTSKLAGRLEVIWVNLGNLPAANDNVLSDGRLNLHKRGSNKSPGPGLNDATYVNAGIGYQLASTLSVGLGFSHRIKLRKSSNFISHTYMLQTIYDILSIAANFRYKKHDFFLSFSYGFRNSVSGVMPIEVGGGRFSAEKQIAALSFSWGYLY